MNGVCSLIIPFVNVITEKLYGKLLPQWALWVVAALCFLWASFRVWRGEHRRLLALPLRMLLSDLEKCRRHWKKHEHDYLKLGTPYFPLAGTPDLPHWSPQNIDEFRDKILLRNEFRLHAQAAQVALTDLGDSRFPELVALGALPVLVTGQQLDEMIRDENTMLRHKITELERSGVKPCPAPEMQYTAPIPMPTGDDTDFN